MKALKLTTTVDEQGRLRLPALTFRPGSRLEVILLEPDVELECEEENDDLLEASRSSLSFWDNQIDDQTWNNA